MPPAFPQKPAALFNLWELGTSSRGQAATARRGSNIAHSLKALHNLRMTAGDFDQDPVGDVDDRVEALAAAQIAIQEHPAQKLGLAIENVNRVASAWLASSADLIKLLQTYENDQKIAAMILSPRGSDSQIIKAKLDQSLHAYVSGIGAVIEQARTAATMQPAPFQEQYQRRQAALLKALPQAVFLAKLRNFVLHRFSAPWEFSGTFGRSISTKISLNVPALLEAKWDAPSRQYLEGQGGQLHFLPLLGPYQNAMYNIVNWFVHEAFAQNKELFDEHNRLVAVYNLTLTGGATDGRDWDERMAHVAENIRRRDKGLPQTDFRTGEEFPQH